MTSCTDTHTQTDRKKRFLNLY